MALCPKQNHIQEKGSSCSHPYHQQLRFHPRTQTLLGQSNCCRIQHFCCEVFLASDKLKRRVARKRGCRDGFVKRPDGGAVESRGREGGEIKFPFCHIVMTSKISVCYIIIPGLIWLELLFTNLGSVI